MSRKSAKLSKKEIEKFFYQLCLATSKIKNEKEAAEFLRDLLTYQEAEMIAKRLKIAQLLIKGLTYDEVVEKLKVSRPTIAKVQEWLRISGEGYRKAIDRMGDAELEIKENEGYYNPEEWGSIKKRYPAYYWPEILLENIIKNSNLKQKRQLKSVIGEMSKMKQKTNLFKRINRLLR
jgi:TrpR-related protein YerC/YecD